MGPVAEHLRSSVSDQVTHAYERTMNTRFLSTTFGLVGIALLGTGCVAEAGDSSADEAVGVAAQPQIDPYRSYSMVQDGAVTASVWGGTNSAGAPVEYWVAKSGYNASAARTINGVSESCSAWKRGVCSASAGSTFYRSVSVETPLNCAFPPGPCTPSASAVSFLGSGSYRTSTASPGVPPTPYAWTYSTGTCEHWANIHNISTGLSAQSPITPLYTSLSQFESSVCALSHAPTTFYTSYYEPVANSCSIPTC